MFSILEFYLKNVVYFCLIWPIHSKRKTHLLTTSEVNIHLLTTSEVNILQINFYLLCPTCKQRTKELFPFVSAVKLRFWTRFKRLLEILMLVKAKLNTLNLSLVYLCYQIAVKNARNVQLSDNYLGVLQAVNYHLVNAQWAKHLDHIDLFFMCRNYHME